MEQEISLVDLISIGIIVLMGKEDRDWHYYETDPNWWAVRLWTRRN